MLPWHGQGELYMFARPLVKSISNVGAVQGCQQFRIVMHAVTDPSIRKADCGLQCQCCEILRHLCETNGSCEWDSI